MLPGLLLVAQLPAAASRERVDLDLAAALGLTPRRRDPAGLFEFEQRRIQRALIQGEMVSADLLDPPGDAVPMKRAEGLECLEDDQPEAAVEDVGPFVWHVLAGYRLSCCLSTDVGPARGSDGRLARARSGGDAPSRAKEIARELVLRDAIVGDAMGRRCESVVVRNGDSGRRRPWAPGLVVVSRADASRLHPRSASCR